MTRRSGTGGWRWCCGWCLNRRRWRTRRWWRTRRSWRTRRRRRTPAPNSNRSDCHYQDVVRWSLIPMEVGGPLLHRRHLAVGVTFASRLALLSLPFSRHLAASVHCGLCRPDANAAAVEALRVRLVRRHAVLDKRHLIPRHRSIAARLDVVELKIAAPVVNSAGCPFESFNCPRVIPVHPNESEDVLVTVDPILRSGYVVGGDHNKRWSASAFRYHGAISLMDHCHR